MCRAALGSKLNTYSGAVVFLWLASLCLPTPANAFCEGACSDSVSLATYATYPRRSRNSSEPGYPTYRAAMNIVWINGDTDINQIKYARFYSGDNWRREVPVNLGPRESGKIQLSYFLPAAYSLRNSGNHLRLYFPTSRGGTRWESVKTDVFVKGVIQNIIVHNDSVPLGQPVRVSFTGVNFGNYRQRLQTNRGIYLANVANAIEVTNINNNYTVDVYFHKCGRHYIHPRHVFDKGVPITEQNESTRARDDFLGSESLARYVRVTAPPGGTCPTTTLRSCTPMYCIPNQANNGCANLQNINNCTTVTY